MAQRMLLIGMAGALGTLARYGLSGMIQRVASSPLPWGTVVVNIVGCFLFGLVWTLADERLVIDAETRLVVLGGFMGAFTTFSTFIFDTGGFVQEAQWLLAGGNILLQTASGLVFLFIGLNAGRVF